MIAKIAVHTKIGQHKELVTYHNVGYTSAKQIGNLIYLYSGAYVIMCVDPKDFEPFEQH